MDLENYQEEICELCETSIIDGSRMTQHFMCEGRFCSKAKEMYIEENEVWKDIKGFKDYQVSNFGDIKSSKHKKDVVMKPWIDNKGYYRISLCIHGKKHSKKIHKLVAIAFMGHEPSGMIEVVDHKDWNKLNNHVDNLQLITNRENASKDQFRHNRTSQYVGVNFDKRRNKWCAEIKINDKKKFLGRFINEIDAAKAYQDKLNEITKCS